MNFEVLAEAIKIKLPPSVPPLKLSPAAEAYGEGLGDTRTGEDRGGANHSWQWRETTKAQLNG